MMLACESGGPTFAKGIHADLVVVVLAFRLPVPDSPDRREWCLFGRLEIAMVFELT